MEDLTDISLRRRIYEFLRAIRSYDYSHDFLDYGEYTELAELLVLLTPPPE